MKVAGLFAGIGGFELATAAGKPRQMLVEAFEQRMERSEIRGVAAE